MPRDLSTEDGAKRLCAHINAYWRARGREANARVEAVHMGEALIFCVRSDMVNGMPQGAGDA